MMTFGDYVTTTQVVTKTRTVEAQVPNIARITDQRFVGFSETTGFLYQEISDGTIRLRLGDNAPYPALGETIWFEHDTPAGSAERAHFTVESYTGSNSTGQFCSVDFDGDSNGTLQHPGHHRVLDYSNDAPCPAGVLLARRDGTGPHTDRYFSQILLDDLDQVFFGTWGKLIDGQPLDKLVLPLTIGYEDPNGIIHKYDRTLEQYLRVFEPGVPHNVTEEVKRTRTVTRTVMVHATRIDKVEVVEDVVDHTTLEGLVTYNEGNGQLVEGANGFSLQTINAPELPQEETGNPITVDLGPYVAGDLTGDVVITQSGYEQTFFNALNGVFTVPVVDIVAAGSSGYEYARNPLASGNIFSSIISISGNSLLVDTISLSGSNTHLPGELTSLSYQVAPGSNSVYVSPPAAFGGSEDYEIGQKLRLIYTPPDGTHVVVEYPILAVNTHNLGANAGPLFVSGDSDGTLTRSGDRRQLSGTFYELDLDYGASETDFTARIVSDINSHLPPDERLQWGTMVNNQLENRLTLPVTIQLLAAPGETPPLFQEFPVSTATVHLPFGDAESELDISLGQFNGDYICDVFSDFTNLHRLTIDGSSVPHKTAGPQTFRIVETYRNGDFQPALYSTLDHRSGPQGQFLKTVGSYTTAPTDLQPADSGALILTNSSTDANRMPNIAIPGFQAPGNTAITLGAGGVYQSDESLQNLAGRTVNDAVGQFLSSGALFNWRVPIAIIFIGPFDDFLRLFPWSILLSWTVIAVLLTLLAGMLAYKYTKSNTMVNLASSGTILALTLLGFVPLWLLFMIFIPLGLLAFGVFGRRGGSSTYQASGGQA